MTRDEFGAPDTQELATYVNGERDLIATGTPAGVGIGFKPQRFLEPGDVVRVAISGIGELSNPIA